MFHCRLLRGLSGCRSDRLLIGEDAEPGSESDRVIHKHPVPENSLLANIDQMSTVHLFDGKSARFSKRTELMDLLKCTKQTSTSLQVTKVKRCCQLIRLAALRGDALQKRCTVRGGAHRWCGYNVDRNRICPDRCNRSGHAHRGNWRLGSRSRELQDFCHSWVPLRTSSVVVSFTVWVKLGAKMRRRSAARRWLPTARGRGEVVGLDVESGRRHTDGDRLSRGLSVLPGLFSLEDGGDSATYSL